MLLQQVPLLREQGVTVRDGGCNCHFVVGVLLIYYAIIEQQAAVWLRAAPSKHWLTCKLAHTSADRGLVSQLL